MISFNDFIKINERHLPSMIKDKVASRKDRRSYIENAIIELGYFFVIDEDRNIEPTQKEIKLNKEIEEKVLKVYDPLDFEEFCQINYFSSYEDLDDVKRYEAFKKFMSKLKNRYFYERYLPFAITYTHNKLNENIVVYANGFDQSRPTRVLMAHYDVNTESSLHDNANDNGASIVILLEYLEESIFPSDKNILVVFTDGEEFGGHGAKSFAKQVAQGLHGKVEWVLNLDVVGIGNMLVFEDIKGKLRTKIENTLTEDIGFIQMPINDAMFLRNGGVDAICMSVIPDEYWDSTKNKLSKHPKFWSFLHTQNDKWDTISTEAMSIAFDSVKKIMSN